MRCAVGRVRFVEQRREEGWTIIYDIFGSSIQRFKGQYMISTAPDTLFSSSCFPLNDTFPTSPQCYLSLGPNRANLPSATAYY